MKMGTALRYYILDDFTLEIKKNCLSFCFDRVGSDGSENLNYFIVSFFRQINFC